MAKGFQEVVPAWLWALILVVAVQILGTVLGWGAVDRMGGATRGLGCLLTVAMVVPGVIRRGGVFAAGLMLAAALVLIGARFALGTSDDLAAGSAVVRLAGAAVILIALAAWAGDYLDARGGERGAALAKLPVLFLMAMGLGAVTVVVYEVLDLLAVYIPIPSSPAMLSDVLVWPMAGVCAWIAVVAGMSQAAGSSQSRAPIATAGVVLALALPVWWLVRVPVAMSCLRGVQGNQPAGMISPFHAVVVVGRHGKQADVDLLWSMLLDPQNELPPRDSLEDENWSSRLMRVLQQRDHKEAGEHVMGWLAQAKRVTPAQMAQFSGVLGSERCYDAAPILLRFSVWVPQGNDNSIADNRDACLYGLEQMGVPEAAPAILYQAQQDRVVNPRSPAEVSRRLSAVLGDEVSRPAQSMPFDQQWDWAKKRATGAANPMEGAQKKLTDKTVDALWDYLVARYRAQGRVPPQIDFYTPSAEEFIKQVKAFEARVAAAAGPATKPG